MLTFIFLYACGQGTDRNNGNYTVDQSIQQANTNEPADGSALFSEYGCFACHSLEGGIMYGPPLNGLFMQEVTVMRQDKEETIVADREYFTRAITDPEYEKVLDYKSRIMPRPDIPTNDVEKLIDYLIGLGEKE